MSVITIVDPVTRIEGHMKVQVTIETVAGKQQVIDAQATGTLFRGFEKLLAGRDPKDAPYITERICGVCPVSHAIAASQALENAASLKIPTNARILRNLTLAANFIQSHILHFYMLASLDYVNPPQSAPWTSVWNADLMRSPALQRIVNNFTTAVTMRREAHEMAAIFAGRMPGLSAIQAGGFTTKPTSSMIALFAAYLSKLLTFITDQYVPDALLLQSVYSDYNHIGKGPGNLLAYGVFDLDDSSAPKRLFKRGSISNAAPTILQGMYTYLIQEHVLFSWYSNTTNYLNPKTGSTIAVDPATKPRAYSWIKAPRINNSPYELGPLARMWVNGDYRNGISVMDRHVARAYEALKIAVAMPTWLAQLTIGGSQFTPLTTPYSMSGEGLTEAPRGALGHWVTTTPPTTMAPNGGPAIQNYQVITPTCWNASPKDSSNVHGPMEQALIGTPVANAAEPIEVLRVIHSFDPCLSCAVHVMRPNGKPVVVLQSGTR